MAGHSQFKNIMYRKGAQDAKRSKIFTKLIREITVAARTGLPDPDMNPRLRSAVQAARAALVLLAVLAALPAFQCLAVNCCSGLLLLRLQFL